MMIMLLVMLMSVLYLCMSSDIRYGYIGCYIDSADRDLNGSQITTSSFTRDTCRTICAEWKYFGLQHRGQCFCGNSFSRTPAHKKTSDSDCGSDLKGRGLTNAIYLVNPRYGYIGCYIDSEDRDLNGAQFLRPRDWNTYRCRIACAEWKYFGLQFGGECFCGNSFSRIPAHKKVADNECGGDLLGDRDRNAIFSVSVASPTPAPTATPTQAPTTPAPTATPTQAPTTPTPTATPTQAPTTPTPTASPTPAPWIPILRCDGNWRSQNRTLNEDFWQTAKTVRICVKKENNNQCVTSSCLSVLDGLRQNPPNINQQMSACNLTCIKNCWQGDDTRLRKLVNNCNRRSNEFFYHACGNDEGVHISMKDNGLCGHFSEQSGPIEIEIQK